MSLNYSQSKIKQFRRCQKQYAFRYDWEAGKELIPVRRKLPLYRGAWMHALQEALHRQWAGIPLWVFEFGEGVQAISEEVSGWEEVHDVLKEQFDQLFDEEQDELGNLPDECERLFRAYLRFWRDDQERYEVATMPDGSPAIEIVVEAPLTKFGVKGNFKGRIDLIVQDLEYESLWVWDAKWVKKVPIPDERMMSPQALMYPWALRTQYDMDPQGFLFNYGRTKPPAIPAVLKSGVLSTRQRMDTDVRTYLQAMKDLHGERWKQYIPFYREKLRDLEGRENLWFRRERIPIEDERVLLALREFVVSTRDIENREKRWAYVPRSYFFNCKFSCDYHDLCVAEFQGLDIGTLVDGDYQVVGERYEEEGDLLDA